MKKVWIYQGSFMPSVFLTALYVISFTLNMANKLVIMRSVLHQNLRDPEKGQNLSQTGMGVDGQAGGRWSLLADDWMGFGTQASEDKIPPLASRSRCLLASFRLSGPPQVTNWGGAFRGAPYGCGCTCKLCDALEVGQQCWSSLGGLCIRIETWP